jgi:hypothetical protein
MEPQSPSEVAEDFVRRAARQLRFAVRGPKGHSATWTAFGRGNDYYIGARPMMGSSKISLHASGICRLALTEQHYDSLPGEGLPQPLDRAFVKWRRSETPPIGAAHVVSLIFPSDHLVQPEPAGAYRKPLMIFGEAPLGKAMEFGFFFSTEEMSALEPRFLAIGKPLLSTKLDNGTTVSIVARVIDFDRSVLPSQLQLDGAPGRILSREVNKIERELAGLTGFFWNSPTDGGSLMLYEIGGMALRRNI